MRALVAIAILFCAGCEKKPTPEELEEQRRVLEAASPKPTPKPGAWMFDKNRNDPLRPPEH